MDAFDHNLTMSASELSKWKQKSKFARLDLELLWGFCGGEGEPSLEFRTDMWYAIEHYYLGPNNQVFLPARERNPLYTKLQKSIQGLHTQLTEMHDHLSFEINAVSIDFEPEQPEVDEDNWPGRDEGLSYGEYHIDRLLTHLEDFSEIVGAARDRHKKSKGKPKQNQNLESTILNLGRVFEKYYGSAPMTVYSYDDILNDPDDEENESRPYQSPFFDFLHAVFWTWNDKRDPTSLALGDAARRAFGLRK